MHLFSLPLPPHPPPAPGDFVCTSYPAYSRAFATLSKQNVKCPESGGGGGGVGVEGESGLGIESVKIKRYGLTMDSKIIQNLKQPFRRKKKRAKIKYIGVFGHLFKR